MTNQQLRTWAEVVEQQEARYRTTTAVGDPTMIVYRPGQLRAVRAQRGSALVETGCGQEALGTHNGRYDYILLRTDEVTTIVPWDWRDTAFTHTPGYAAPAFWASALISLNTLLAAGMAQVHLVLSLGYEAQIARWPGVPPLVGDTDLYTAVRTGRIIVHQHPTPYAVDEINKRLGQGDCVAFYYHATC
jgi:hypothetical protein